MKWYHIAFLFFLMVVCIAVGWFGNDALTDPKVVTVEIRDTVRIGEVKYYPKYAKLTDVDIKNPPKLSFTTGDYHVTYDSVRTEYFTSDLFIWSQGPVDSMDYKYKIYFYKWLDDQQLPTPTLALSSKQNKWKVAWHLGVIGLGFAGIATERYKAVAFGYTAMESVRLLNEIW